MEQRKRINLMNFPGKTLLFSKEQCLIYYRFTLSESVDKRILEDAVNEVLGRAKYFKTRFVWKDEFLYATQTEQHCIVYGERDNPVISGDKYLFYVQTFNNVIVFCWDHVLADFNGFTPFAIEVLESYLSRKNRLPHEQRSLMLLQEYTGELPASKYNGEFSHHKTSQENNLADESRYIISLSREDWIRASRKRCIKPFALLVSIFYEAYRQCGGNGPKSFGFPVDIRRFLGLEGIPCNCLTFADLYYEGSPEQSFEDVIHQIGKLVDSSLEKDYILKTYANSEKWMRDVLSTSKKMPIKKRIIQMGCELQQTIDFWISYVGDFLRDTEPWLVNYVLNAEIWLSYKKAPLFAECLVINGKLNLCISSRLGNRDVFSVIKHLIEYLEIEML